MLDSLSFTDIALILAAVAYLADRVMESRGWNRSSKMLRRENEDLTRRNEGLEMAVARLEEQVAAQAAKVHLLKETVRDLQARDQKAVLSNLEMVAAVASERHESYVAYQVQTVNLLVEIRDRLAPAA